MTNSIGTRSEIIVCNPAVGNLKNSFKMAKLGSKNVQFSLTELQKILNQTDNLAAIWLNIYGRQVVQSKLKKGLKTQKVYFYPFLSLCQTA